MVGVHRVIPKLPTEFFRGGRGISRCLRPTFRQRSETVASTSLATALAKVYIDIHNSEDDRESGVGRRQIKVYTRRIDIQIAVFISSVLADFLTN